MDNDLMARRLRPPSQPSPQNGQPTQPASPWDVDQDPPFAPPDPAARADVPWDRPTPEAWPPSEESGTDYQQTWSAQSGAPASSEAEPAWPAADAVGDAAPWDRPADDQSLDPDDAMAPVVGDVHAPVGVWHEWAGENSANGYANGNGNGHYAAGAPEPMTVAAHSDQPRGGDEPRSDAWVDAPSGGTGPALPKWPAEDDLTPASSGRGPVMPEDSWPITPLDAEPPAVPAATDTTPDPAPAPEQLPEMPVAAPPSVTPVVTSAEIVPSPAGSPQNMVLRIELAIVDQTDRANPADAAKRVGPDAGVRAPEYNPRTHGGRAPMPEPEYEWGAPLPADQRRQPQSSPQGQPPRQQPRQVAPPPSAWSPAPAEPTQMDWGLPQVGGAQHDQPAPWSTPTQSQQRQPAPQQPVAPPPTWALTEPTPTYVPEQPQYMPPPALQHQQPYQPAQQSAWPPSQSPDPLYGLPAAPNFQPAPYQPAQQQYAPQYPPQAVQSVPSAPAAASRARTGQAGPAADQADLWFLNNQPATPALEDEAGGLANKPLTLMTIGLTIGFALLVIVLVLVFIQLMTSLLK